MTPDEQKTTKASSKVPFNRPLAVKYAGIAEIGTVALFLTLFVPYFLWPNMPAVVGWGESAVGFGFMAVMFLLYRRRARQVYTADIDRVAGALAALPHVSPREAPTSTSTNVHSAPTQKVTEKKWWVPANKFLAFRYAGIALGANTPMLVVLVSTSTPPIRWGLAAAQVILWVVLFVRYRLKVREYAADARNGVDRFEDGVREAVAAVRSGDEDRIRVALEALDRLDRDELIAELFNWVEDATTGKDVERLLAGAVIPPPESAKVLIDAANNERVDFAGLRGQNSEFVQLIASLQEAGERLG